MPTFVIHDEGLYSWILFGFYALIPVIFLASTKTAVPYGRHVKRGLRVYCGVRESWIFMWSPTLWAMVFFYSTGEEKLGVVPLIILRIYQLHFFNRTLIHPIRMRGMRGKGMPLVVAFWFFFLNILNSYVQARSLSHYTSYPDSWLTSPQFIIGVTLFFLGFIVNLWSDSILIALRVDDDDRSYRMPQGGPFRLISSPNYSSEIVIWLGWAMLTWSPAGLAFFLFTLGNLVPRAKSNHEWCLNKFNDYPRERKILVPYLY